MDGSAHPKKTVKAMTPMMAQYLEMKQQAGDALLFFRMGDFYELFFEDAVKASAALDITLTKRGQHNGEDIPMCGVPWHSHENYLARLIKAGFKVALCEQTEDPAEAKKRGAKSVVRREIVRHVTPGTLTEETLLDTRQSNFLLSLGTPKSGRAAIAWADMSTGEICTRLITKDEIGTELAALAPREILVSEDMSEEWRSRLATAGGNDRLTWQPAAIFNQITARKRLQELYQVSSLEAYGDFQAGEIAATGALVSYIELTQMGRMPAFKPPKRSSLSSHMVIDAVTRSSLELTTTQRGGTNGSLLSAVDRTITGPGARLLASWLGRPLTEVPVIHERQQAIEYFVSADTRRDSVRNDLRSAPDMFRALSRLVLERGGPRDLAALRDGVFIAERISDFLQESEKKELTQINSTTSIERLLRDLCPVENTTKPFKDLLQRALSQNLPLQARDGGFIARGYDAELDELVSLRDNARQVIVGLEEKYRLLADVKSLKIKHNNILGYFVETPVAQSGKLQTQEAAKTFIHRQTLASAVRFTTVELSDLDARISRARDGAIARELTIFADLIEMAQGMAGDISTIAEALAMIDVLTGLADLATAENFTCPVVDDSSAFSIEGGRHPVVEQALRVTEGAETKKFIPNDCVLTEGNETCLWLVTGPNMAGKSTFLRQTALIAILAQIGSFVPADAARIGVVDRIFSRVGASDDLAGGRSTFMVEMVETSAILNQATEKSLVILDEIGRGTATFDGLSIAWAAAEYLHDVNRCRGLFATHYHEITNLSERLPRIRNVSMKVQEWKQEIVFLHEVVPGPADRSYGVAVARLAGLPKAAVTRAEEVLQLLEQGKVHQSGGVEALINDLPLFAAQTPDQEKPDLSEVIEAVREADPDALSPREALDVLYQLQDLLKQHE